jgi:hypothetical protein
MELYDRDTGEYKEVKVGRNGRRYLDDGIDIKSDTITYIKGMKSHYFFDLELSSMELRCWRIIGYYLNKNSEFFYMTKEAMLILLESHFQKSYNQRVVQNALNKLEKIGCYLKVKDGLCIINHNVIFYGDRRGVLYRNQDYDLFGMRDPMARNIINREIDYKTNVMDYIMQHEISIPKKRAECLGILRKASKLRRIK